MTTTRTYDVYLLSKQFGATAPDRSWQTRDIAMYVTTDLAAFLKDVQPAVDAGMQIRVVTSGRSHVAIERWRMPLLRFYYNVETWSRYDDLSVLGVLRRALRWDPETDPESEARWTRLAGGAQVILWSPRWGYDGRLMTLLNTAGL